LRKAVRIACCAAGDLAVGARAAMARVCAVIASRRAPPDWFTAAACCSFALSAASVLALDLRTDVWWVANERCDSASTPDCVLIAAVVADVVLAAACRLPMPASATPVLGPAANNDRARRSVSRACEQASTTDISQLSGHFAVLLADFAEQRGFDGRRGRGDHRFDAHLRGWQSVTALKLGV